MRPINEVIIHCTATRPDFMRGNSTAAKVAEVRRWHTTPPRNWSDIGYHYLIDRDGTVSKGRPVERVGAHVRGHNTGTIGVSLFGGHGSAETDNFFEHFTQAQDSALRNLLYDLRSRHGDVRVSGHNEYAAKACPGFSVDEWLARKPAPKPAAVTPRKPQSLAQIITAFFRRFFGG